MKAGRIKQWIIGIAAATLPLAAFAQQADPVRWQLNMGRGVTHLSQNAYDAHPAGTHDGGGVTPLARGEGRKSAALLPLTCSITTSSPCGRVAG